MKNQILTLVAFLISLNGYSTEIQNNPFHNRKEKSSIYLNENGAEKIRELNDALLGINIGQEEMIAIYQEVFNNAVAKGDYVCEIKLLNDLNDKLPWKKMALRANLLDNILLHLRLNNFIDDVSTKYLLNALEIFETNPDIYLENINNEDFTSWNKKFNRHVQKETAEVFKEFCRTNENKLSAWKKAVEKINRITLKETLEHPDEINQLLALCYRNKAFCRTDLILMGKLAKSDAHLIKSNLQDYYNIIKLARDGQNVPTSFSSIKAPKSPNTLRQEFYEKYAGNEYSRQQIEALGNLLNKFQDRVFNSIITIQINIEEKKDTINLTLLEQYHFAVRLLKKETTELESKYFFYKVNMEIEVIDVLIAADELGLIPAEAMEEIADMEQLWNPNEPKKNKLKNWANIIESAGTTILPPPFNFILTGGLIIVEVFSNDKKKEEHEEDHHLF